MSKTTLVQRLRERKISGDTCIGDQFSKILTGSKVPYEKCGGGDCFDCYNDTLEQLAGIIEGEYTSNPRYYDGEFIRIGDHVQELNDSEVVSWDVSAWREVTLYSADSHACCSKYHKSALDGDGVPIECGDIIYSIDSNTLHKVIKVNEDSTIDVAWEDGFPKIGVNGKWFTHKKPDTPDMEKLQDLIAAIDNVYGSKDHDLHLQLEKAYDMCVSLMEVGA